MEVSEDARWLLNRIRSLEDFGPPWFTTHKTIWQGCYDVWTCDQDRIDSVEIPKKRMKEAESAGLIVSEKKMVNDKEIEVWKLTSLGREAAPKIQKKEISP